MKIGRTCGGIYTASKVNQAPHWRRWRDEMGAPVISTWIDEAGPGETADFNDLWERCLLEASTCDVMVLFREGDEVLKGAWIELGAALTGRCKRVNAVGIGDFTIARYKSKIVHYDDVTEAMYDAIRFCGVEVVR